jgi:hypothetical protein
MPADGRSAGAICYFRPAETITQHAQLSKEILADLRRSDEERHPRRDRLRGHCRTVAMCRRNAENLARPAQTQLR